MEESRGEDIISKLPDALIHYMLSLIDIKYAVQTSVLSKRWIGIWKSTPYVSIERGSFPRGKEHDQRFIYFVDMVFILRDDSGIQRFRLHWHRFELDDIVAKNVNRWTVQAVKHNVQEMTIEIFKDHHSAYEIPHQLLSCKTLRKLEMQVDGYRYCGDIILPKSMDLPRLRILKLNGFSISNVELTKRLFSSCPLLKTLEIANCDIGTDDQRNLIIDSLSLKRFRFMYTHRPLQSQNQNMANIIKLSAPNLKFFKFSSSVKHYSLENCSSLSSVYFDITLKEKGESENAKAYLELPSEESEVYAKRMMKFLGAVYMVKKMRLSLGFLEVFSRASGCRPPCLSNLQYLALEMWSTRSCLRATAFLLSISPNIIKLFIESKKSKLADIGDDWEAGLSLPEMLSHLKYVHIVEVEGSDVELKLLSFLLNNAKILKKVVLCPRSTLRSPDRVRRQFKDKLRALPRASPRIKMQWPATKRTDLI